MKEYRAGAPLFTFPMKKWRTGAPLFTVSLKQCRTGAPLFTLNEGVPNPLLRVKSGG